MIRRLIPIAILLFTTIIGKAQSPQNILLESSIQFENLTESFACPDQNAGTISFDNFNGQSNDIDLDTLYFCFNDQIDIVHNGDADLTGDPNPGSTPGVTYGFFDCPPTATGPNLAGILSDPCILNTPPPLQGIWVTAGGMANGDNTFFNDGNLQNFFNMDNPLLVWFAPITIDDFSVKEYEADPLTNETGPCVNVNTAQAFAVVYLNEVQTSNFDNQVGSNLCRGSFEVNGGLPEFDNTSFYDITVELVTDPSVTGTVVSGDASHGETVQFDVPTPGIYNVTVSDGKSCSSNFLANMTNCQNVTLSLPSINGAPGDMVCLDVTVEDGFLNLVSMQYSIVWDNSILEYSGVANLNPNMPGLDIGTSFNNVGNALVFSWFDIGGFGISLPNGDVLYQICFTIVGQNGDCSPVEFSNSPSVIDIFNSDSDQIALNPINGSVCVAASSIVLDMTQDSVSCPGFSDGSFNVTVSGGTAPYNLSWQGSGPIQGPIPVLASGDTFTSPQLPAGTYSITVTDSEAVPNTIVSSVEILEDPQLNIIFNEMPPICNGDSGSIAAILILDSVIVPNPGLSYSFEWSTMEVTETIDGIPSGFYSLTITDAKGCTTAASTFLPQPAPITPTLVLDTATCSGIADGGIMLMVDGGTPDVNGNYTIKWPTIGGGLVFTNDLSNLSGTEPGTYPLCITDANGCILNTDVFVPAEKTLSVNANLSNILCEGECNGQILVVGNTVGDVPATPYIFSWNGNPPPPPSVDMPTSSSLNDLCVGVYTITMQDQSGCQIDTTFFITEPTPIIIDTIEVNSASCFPGNDGSIVIGVTGGTYPYTYMWDAPPTDSVATDLGAGNYMVTVADGNNCENTASFTIGMPEPPEITLLENDTLNCEDSVDGSLTVNIIPGSSPIQDIFWNPGGAGATINNLGIGTYIVTVTAEDGCQVMDTAFVEAPTPLMIDSIQLQAPNCPGDGGGQIAVFASGGTAPYFFDWSNGFMGIGVAVIGGGTVSAGSYDVTITDANNCPSVIETILLDNPPSIEVAFSGIEAVSCFNSNGVPCDGDATATGSYSDGSTGIFDFMWSSGEADNDVPSSSAALLCQDFQFVTISDGSCFIIDTLEIPAPPPITPDQEIEDVSCFGLDDGTITLLPAGGTPPYNILWDDMVTTGPVITGLIAGDYIATITDNNGCIYQHQVNILEPQPLEIFINNVLTKDVACPGGADGIIAVAAQGGNINLGPIDFIWENNVAPLGSSTAEGLTAGSYSVTVVDAKDCMDSLSYVLSEPPPIQFSLGDFDPVKCFGENTFITVENITGGNPVTYQFSVDNGINRLPGEPSPVFAGTHLITVVDVVNNCTADTIIEIFQPLPISVDLPSIVEIELGDTLTQLDPNIISSLPIDTFLWTPASQLSCADCKNPFVNAIQSQLYTLTIIDINGCPATAQVFVDVDLDRNVFIPNVFSPDDDGINDIFRVFTGLGVRNIRRFHVYDRWGELMFDQLNVSPSADGTIGWDGRFNGERMNPAVFVYIIEVEFLDGSLLVYRGDVTLLR